MCVDAPVHVHGVHIYVTLWMKDTLLSSCWRPPAATRHSTTRQARPRKSCNQVCLRLWSLGAFHMTHLLCAFHLKTRCMCETRTVHDSTHTCLCSTHTRLCIHPTSHPSTHLSSHPSTHPSTHSSTHPSTHPPTHRYPYLRTPIPILTHARTYAPPAQLFMEAEMDSRLLDFSGFEENLMEAVDCYNLAIGIYCRMRRVAFAATLHAEVANALAVFGRFSEAAVHYRRASRLLDGSPVPSIAALENAIDCHIRVQDYASALTLLIDVVRMVDTVAKARGTTRVQLGSTDDFFYHLGTALRPSVSMCGRECVYLCMCLCG